MDANFYPWGRSAFFVFSMTDPSAPNKTRELGIFMPASVDDFGLTAAQFRVLCHLSRRAGKNRECYPSAPSIARVCKLHEDTVWRCLKELEKLQFIKRSKGKFKSNNYTMTHPEARGGGNGGSPESDGLVAPESGGCHPPATDGRKGNQMEGKTNKSIHPHIASVPDAVVVGSDYFLDIPDELNEFSDVKTVKPKRDPIVSALAACGGADPSQIVPSQWSGIEKALREIKAVFPELTAEEISRRSVNYRTHMREAILTPFALAKHWALCDKQNKPVGSKSGGTSTYEEEAIAHGYTL